MAHIPIFLTGGPVASPSPLLLWPPTKRRRRSKIKFLSISLTCMVRNSPTQIEIFSVAADDFFLISREIYLWLKNVSIAYLQKVRDGKTKPCWILHRSPCLGPIVARLSFNRSPNVTAAVVDAQKMVAVVVDLLMGRNSPLPGLG